MAQEPQAAEAPRVEAETETATTPATRQASPAAAAEAATTDTPAAQQQPDEGTPEPDPEACRGLALSQEVFEEAVLAGEFDGTEYVFYLEPGGVLNARLVCARSHPGETRPAGIVMTRAARDARVVFFDDGINPERYELHYPKEIGYLKSIQHYRPESREHALYPWSKRY